jgi:molecular chaperone GrpE
MSKQNEKKEVAKEKKEVKKTGKSRAASKKGQSKPDATEAKLEEINSKYSELNDKYIRLYSEFDNYRKRTLKEKTALVKTASEDVIVSLLPVLDDLERAITAANEEESESSHLEGLKLIHTKFFGALKQKGLEAIESMGEPFDVDFHEAITNIPAPSEELKGKVVDEIQKGYILNGKVIRFSRVVVGA